MTYIDRLAGSIRQLLPPELLPDGDNSPLFRMYAVLAMAKGDSVVLEDVHDAWAAWMSGQNPHHESLRPLGDLPPEIQGADRPYLEAIRAVARERGLGR